MIQVSNDSSDMKSVRRWQFPEKEKPSDYWIEYLPFEKNFRRRVETATGQLQDVTAFWNRIGKRLSFWKFNSSKS